jgi:hypothetical protein
VTARPTGQPVPGLPGVLSSQEVRATAASIAAAQEASGAIPWFAGGQVDVWDHVECAMALLVGGEVEAAERAYAWLFATQRGDGSWPLKQVAGQVVDPGVDANMTAYVAVGVWHHWLVRADRAFVHRAWPVVRRALDCVVRLQLPFGGVAWARGADGPAASSALVAGSSSIHHALTCGVALAELLDEAQPEWELAAGRLRHALWAHEHDFEDKRRFSMDWYYPVLGGAVRGRAALRRLEARWEDFTVPGLGILCVDDRPWVTGAETCELALALDAVAERERAVELVAAMQHLREGDGSYWTGYVFADDARWPVERSTWTAAAVVLAVDALSRTSPGSELFRSIRPAEEVADPGTGCGCAPSPSGDGVSGRAAHTR